MPNWNYNLVIIEAPKEEVKEYLIREDDRFPKDETYLFNMDLIFPKKRIPSIKDDWNANELCDWSVENTGSKWFPDDINISVYKGKTHLNYHTARTPNNKTLSRLHEITGWKITNNFEEAGQWFEGVFTCENGVCSEEITDYKPACDSCSLNLESKYFEDDPDGIYCNDCYTKYFQK